MLMSPADLLIDRNAGEIDNGVGQIADKIDRSAVIRKSVVVSIVGIVIRPIERIKSQLEMVRDSNFHFLAKTNLVKTRSAIGRSCPSDCIFQFHAAWCRGRRLVEESKVARASQSCNSRPH